MSPPPGPSRARLRTCASWAGVRTQVADVVRGPRALIWKRHRGWADGTLHLLFRQPRWERMAQLDTEPALGETWGHSQGPKGSGLVSLPQGYKPCLVTATCPIPCGLQGFDQMARVLWMPWLWAREASPFRAFPSWQGRGARPVKPLVAGRPEHPSPPSALLHAALTGPGPGRRTWWTRRPRPGGPRPGRARAVKTGTIEFQHNVPGKSQGRRRKTRPRGLEVVGLLTETGNRKQRARRDGARKGPGSRAGVPECFAA